MRIWVRVAMNGLVDCNVFVSVNAMRRDKNRTSAVGSDGYPVLVGMSQHGPHVIAFLKEPDGDCKDYGRAALDTIEKAIESGAVADLTAYTRSVGLDVLKECRLVEEEDDSPDRPDCLQLSMSGLGSSDRDAILASSGASIERVEFMGTMVRLVLK